MSNTVIRVENLGKKYMIAHQQEIYTTLRDKIAIQFKSAVGKLRSKADNKYSRKEEFWALQDISFEVQQGERLGIIGRNGAGKSTLLKVLSRITEPSTGRISLQGRVASLLEVGTGFHPELTGRENIYLNGAILGMSRVEIRRKFDEIVAFAEVEKFLDTPVKRYSSGMYVRLAFAVAAHLEPEILIVDEVLAVGDVQFQKKCLGKMESIAEKEGRTVLFVSHNLAAIKSLCSRALMLARGQVKNIGNVDSVIDEYMTVAMSKSKRQEIISSCQRFELKFPYWVDKNDQPVSIYAFGDRYKLRFEFNFWQPLSKLEVGFAVVNSLGQRIFTSHLSDDSNFVWRSSLKGKVVIETDLNIPSLAPGIYNIIFGVRDEEDRTVIYSEDELKLEINAVNKVKNAAQGLLFHTSIWKYAD